MPYIALKLPDIKRSIWIAVVTLLLLAINFAVDYPGIMELDAIEQYEQATSGQFTDWHPPIMAFVWSLLRHVAPGPQTMLAFELIPHWLGFALIADGLCRTRRRKAGWLMLVSAASPLFIFYNRGILKDVGLASTFIAGFGIIFWYRIQGLRPSAAAVVVALMLIAYGTLVRANAVFALGPLLLYVLVDPKRISAVRLVMFSFLLSVAAIPVSTGVNHILLRAAPTGVIQALQLFDLAGIARHTGDPSVLSPAVHLSAAEVDRCYTPYWWDTLSPWGTCNFVSGQLGPIDPAANHGQKKLWGDGLTKIWLDAIIAHPAAYSLHRLKHFNSSLNFFVPARHCRFAPGCGEREAGKIVPTTERDIRWDYVRKNALFWPVSWIGLGVCMIMLLGLSPTSPPLSASRTLLISGLGYSLGYAVVGVATDVRYHYWTIMAIQTSLIVAFPLLVARIRTMDRTVIACVLLLILIVSAGMFARITDNQSLIF